VKVGEGDGACTFGVHQTLICEKSPFFMAALDGKWKESHKKLVELPEDDVNAFRLYLNWIYKGLLPCGDVATNGISDLSPVQKSDVNKEYTVLINAYILGDKLGDLDFADAVIDTFISSANAFKYSPGSHLQYIYVQTPVASPLRRLLIDMLIIEGLTPWISNNWTSLEKSTLSDLALALFNQKPPGTIDPKSAPYKLSSCIYHQHKDKPCYKLSMAQLQLWDSKALAKRGSLDVHCSCLMWTRHYHYCGRQD